MVIVVFHVRTVVPIVHYKVQCSLLGLLEVIIYSTLSIQEGREGGVIVRKRE